MLRVILKYSTILGIILVLVAYLRFIPIMNLYFDRSIEGVLRFVTIGGVMMYAINGFLKYHNAKGMYNYGIGFVISLATGIFGTLVYMILISATSLQLNDSIIRFYGMIPIAIRLLPLILILSLIMPATFRSKKGNKRTEDILDVDM